MARRDIGETTRRRSNGVKSPKLLTSSVKRSADCGRIMQCLLRWGFLASAYTVIRAGRSYSEVGLTHKGLSSLKT
jgi:hypothetical protein